MTGIEKLHSAWALHDENKPEKPEKPGQSPFIPGTYYQWAWDSTSLGWLKECPRKYYYHMVRGLVGRGEPIHLEFGILYHGALELYDKLRFSGVDYEDAVRQTVGWVLKETWRNGRPWRSSRDLPTDDRASLKSRENLVRTVVWYLDKFRNDAARTKALPNGAPMVELNFKFQLPWSINIDHPYYLCGYLDRVVEFQGQDFVMDRKTTTQTLGNYYWEQYSPDNQMSLYTVAAKVAFETPISGVIIDAAQIAVGFSRFGRAFAMRTRDQVDEWMKDLKIWLRQAEYYAEEAYWPMNDKSCHKYGGCPFVQICNHSNVIREKFIETNFEVRSWNPLTPR